jgi:hypothetical protein
MLKNDENRPQRYSQVSEHIGPAVPAPLTAPELADPKR